MAEYLVRRVWNIEDHEVTYLHIDYRFAFECWWYTANRKDNRLVVTLENEFILHYADRTVVCHPEDVNSVKEAVPILHKAVSSLTAYRDGRLLVSFADGTELHVSKNREYESWEAQGDGELADVRLLCSPHEGPPWNE